MSAWVPMVYFRRKSQGAGVCKQVLKGKKKMHNLNVQNYVLVSGFAEGLSLGAVLSDK